MRDSISLTRKDKEEWMLLVEEEKLNLDKEMVEEVKEVVGVVGEAEPKRGILKNGERKIGGRGGSGGDGGVVMGGDMNGEGDKDGDDQNREKSPEFEYLGTNTLSECRNRCCISKDFCLFISTLRTCLKTQKIISIHLIQWKETSAPTPGCQNFRKFREIVTKTPLQQSSMQRLSILNTNRS